MSSMILSVGIKYSMRDPFCGSSCRASRTAQLDSLDTTSSTGSTRRARQARLAN